MSATVDNQILSRQERQMCRQRSKELRLVNQRLNCPSELKIKVILVGNSGVGKTSLIQKFVDDKADIRNTQVTMLCDFHLCNMNLTGKWVNFRIWDTGGMERFHETSLVSSFYRKSDGVLLVFSVEDHSSFMALPRWLERVRENVGQGSQFDCCIVGNKSDKADGRMVSRMEAERFAHQLGFPYIETSALDAVNVHKAFTDLALAVIRRYDIVRQFETSQTNGGKSFKLGNGNSGGDGGGGSSGKFCSGCN